MEDAKVPEAKLSKPPRKRPGSRAKVSWFLEATRSFCEKNPNKLRNGLGGTQQSSEMVWEKPKKAQKWFERTQKGSEMVWGKLKQAPKKLRNGLGEAQNTLQEAFGKIPETRGLPGRHRRSPQPPATHPRRLSSQEVASKSSLIREVKRNPRPYTLNPKP